MSADTSAIKTALETAASHSPHIVPVFHSYGGIPGSDAAKQKVLRLIYIGSFVFPANTSLLSLSGGKPAAWAQSLPNNPKYRYVPDPIPTFFHDVEPARAQETAAHLVRNAVSAFRESTKHAGWSGFECTYVFCSEDRAAPRAAAERMLGALTGEQRARWRTEETGGSHSPFLSRPAELAGLLGKIIREEGVEVRVV